MNLQNYSITELEQFHYATGDTSALSILASSAADLADECETLNSEASEREADCDQAQVTSDNYMQDMIRIEDQLRSAYTLLSNVSTNDDSLLNDSLAIIDNCIDIIGEDR